MTSKSKYNYDVSIVIPVYNVEKYLRECLDSIVNQKYNFNKIEVILINDGSKDNSLEICKMYCDKYNNFKLIDKKNAGVSAARNDGIKKSTGKYILILDSDDFLSNNAISNLFDFFEAHYDEIDLLTYPIYFYTLDKKTSLHPRYAAYDKGSGIYDVEEYVYLNQSTVNIMFKNTKDLFYDETMKLSEDQKFDTQLIMKKGKIGYCKDAIYYYRRHGGGVSQNINSMIYCFESIMEYNEWLIETYTNDGQLSKYVQSLIANTINWRIKSNQLIPYQYENEEYEQSYERIINLIKHIDNDVIINMSNMSILHKMFFLKQKGTKFEFEILNNELLTKVDGAILQKDKNITLQLTNFFFDANILHINGYFDTPIFEYLKPTVYMVIKNKKGNIKKEKCSLKYSMWSEKTAHFKTNTLYRIEEKLNVDDISNVKMFLYIKNNKFNVCFNYKKTATYITESTEKYAHIKNKKELFIQSKNIINIIKFRFMKRLKYFRTNPKLMVLRNIYMCSYSPKTIWLYMDRRGVFDNAYFQFKHDFNKKDGIKRYYVYDDKLENIKNKFNIEEQKYLLKYKSLKHRKLYLKCSLLLSSFCDEITYSPFGKSNFKYLDIKKYKLIYLQHGVLHADLKLMYGREFTDIYKFVISSKFENKNLVKNYLYKQEDFIKSGMPRLDINNNSEVENKIIFAPTWRKYLIGTVISGDRALFKEKFLSSSYYKKINEILNNPKLIAKLEEKRVILEFKLHPIFEGYKDLFDFKSKNVVLSCEEVNLAKYKMFITDFSSFQFDFIKYNRPILYFLPDRLEFKGGLHSYSNLDLKYEDAFGDLYLEPEKLVERIIKEIDSDFKNSPKYSSRMNKFFFAEKDHREVLYKNLIKIK